MDDLGGLIFFIIILMAIGSNILKAMKKFGVGEEGGLDDRLAEAIRQAKEGLERDAPDRSKWVGGKPPVKPVSKEQSKPRVVAYKPISQAPPAPAQRTVEPVAAQLEPSPPRTPEPHLPYAETSGGTAYRQASDVPNAEDEARAALAKQKKMAELASRAEKRRVAARKRQSDIWRIPDAQEVEARAEQRQDERQARGNKRHRLKQGIIYREILGPPRAMQKRKSRLLYSER